MFVKKLGKLMFFSFHFILYITKTVYVLLSEFLENFRKRKEASNKENCEPPSKKFMSQSSSTIYQSRKNSASCNSGNDSKGNCN